MREGNSRLGLLGSARRLRILGFDDQPARRAGDGLRRPHLARCAQMQVEDKLVTLTPGMAVTAEIKTGLAHRAELSALAAHALPAQELAGAVRNSLPPGDE
jgi:hypothetical protein